MEAQNSILQKSWTLSRDNHVPDVLKQLRRMRETSAESTVIPRNGIFYTKHLVLTPDYLILSQHEVKR